MTFNEYWNSQARRDNLISLDIARSAYEAGAREEAELKQAWKDKAISLRARVGALEEALVLAAIPLEAIKASVKWELSTDINAAVGTALIAIRRVLAPPEPKAEATTLDLLNEQTAEIMRERNRLATRVGELEGALDGIRRIRPMIRGTKSIDEPRLGWKDYQDAWKAVDAALAVPPEPEPKAPEPPVCPTCGSDDILESLDQFGEDVDICRACAKTLPAPVPQESVRAEEGKGKFDCEECGAEKAIITMQHKPGCNTGKWAAASQRSIGYAMTDPGNLCGGCGFLRRDCTCASEPKTSAAAGVMPAIGVLLTCGHVMGDGLCREHCRYPSEAAPYDPVMCSCGREFDTPQALWDHYVKDGASDEERESHGATTPVPREPCCDLASRGTHRKGCTGEPMSKQIADLTGRVAPLTDAELVAIRLLLDWCAAGLDGQRLLKTWDAASIAAVAARKEPKS